MTDVIARQGTEINLRDDIKVDLVEHYGDDKMIARAARVSTQRDEIDGLKIEGLIKYLLKNKHLSPFAHVGATFRIEAPIFVAREWMRHRTQNFNETSARYSKLKPDFYLPAYYRPIIQAGSGAYPLICEGYPEQVSASRSTQANLYEDAWTAYEELIKLGVANEVARNVLPVAVYTTWYATASLRNWLEFLALRTAPNAQYEIRNAAYKLAGHLDKLFPISMRYGFHEV